MVALSNDRPDCYFGNAFGIDSTVCTHGNEYASSSYWQLMIPLRKRTIELSDKGKDLLLHLYHDTQDPNTGSLNVIMYSQELRLADKIWRGNVDLNERKFSLQRASHFSRNSSQIVMHGQEIKISEDTRIEITYRLSWGGVFGPILIFGMLILIASVYPLDLTSWIIGICLTILPGLLCLLELNKSEDKIMEYIQKYCSNI